MLFLIILGSFASFVLGLDENRWIKIDDHCVRPYGYSAPLLCFEFFVPDNDQISLVPKFASSPTSTQGSTTNTPESLFDEPIPTVATTTSATSTFSPRSEQQTAPKRDPETPARNTSSISTMATPTLKPPASDSTAIFVASSICSTLLLFVFGVAVAYKCGRKHRAVPSPPLRPPPPKVRGEGDFEEVPLYETVPPRPHINLEFPNTGNRTVFGRGFTWRFNEQATTTHV